MLLAADQPAIVHLVTGGHIHADHDLGGRHDTLTGVIPGMEQIYRAAVVGLSGIGARRAPVVSGGLRRPMGRSHVSCYVEHPRTELVGVCDLRSEALDDFRETWPDLPDVAIHTDFAKLLAEQQPDIVSVVTGDHVHADLTVASAEAGARAVFCPSGCLTQENS